MVYQSTKITMLHRLITIKLTVITHILPRLDCFLPYISGHEMYRSVSQLTIINKCKLLLTCAVPQVNIEPPGDRHVKAGSQVRIDCHITDVVQIPDYIFWYHDNVRVLDRANENLEVSRHISQ